MYLNKLVLNLRSRQARIDAAVPYELHRTLVTHAFGGPHQENRVLFRIEPASRSREESGPVVLVQSLHEPDWSNLPEDYCHTIDGPRQFNPQLVRGMQLAFRLVANPIIRTRRRDENNEAIRSRGTEGHVRFLRRGLLKEEEQRAWLERKGEEGGFLPQFVQISPMPGVRQKPGRISHERKGALPHFTVRFDGVLSVTDVDAFRTILAAGIGSAKAFGCGLLSIAPLRS